MIVYIDADACPVISLTEKNCRDYQIPLVAVKDYNHELDLEYGDVVTLEQGNDHADLYIANMVSHGDLIITNDMGLASLVLGKNTYCINFYGNIIDQNNIDFLLHSRHVKAKGRRNKKYGKGVPVRTPENNIRFEQTLIKILEEGKNEYIR